MPCTGITGLFRAQAIGKNIENAWKAVLTNGFVKKSQKTPKAEKELAKKYKADYERRYGNEQL